MKSDGPSRAFEFLCSSTYLPAKGKRHEISAVHQTNLLAEISSLPLSHKIKSTISNRYYKTSQRLRRKLPVTLYLPST
jgi:hypothetical protein